MDPRLSRLTADYQARVAAAVGMLTTAGVAVRPGTVGQGDLKNGFRYIAQDTLYAVYGPEWMVDINLGENGEIEAPSADDLLDFVNERLSEYGFESLEDARLILSDEPHPGSPSSQVYDAKLRAYIRGQGEEPNERMVEKAVATMVYLRDQGYEPEFDESNGDLSFMFDERCIYLGWDDEGRGLRLMTPLSKPSNIKGRRLVQIVREVGQQHPRVEIGERGPLVLVAGKTSIDHSDASGNGLRQGLEHVAAAHRGLESRISQETDETSVVTSRFAARSVWGLVLSFGFALISAACWNTPWLRYSFFGLAILVGFPLFESGMKRFFLARNRSPRWGTAATFALIVPVAIFGSLIAWNVMNSPSNAAEKWFEAMQRDDLAAQMEMWDDVSGMSWIIDPWSWSLESKESDGDTATLKYRVKSSTEGGLPIEKRWTVSMKYDEEDKHWLITGVY